MLEQPEPQYGSAQYPQVKMSQLEEGHGKTTQTEENLLHRVIFFSSFWAGHDNRRFFGSRQASAHFNNGLPASYSDSGDSAALMFL